jgi:hypothetical protein
VSRAGDRKSPQLVVDTRLHTCEKGEGNWKGDKNTYLQEGPLYKGMNEIEYEERVNSKREEKEFYYPESVDHRRKTLDEIFD